MAGKAKRREQKATAHAARTIEVPDAIPEDLAEDAHWAIGFKQHAVVENMFGVGDIPPLITMSRDGDQLLRAFTYKIDRDIGLEFVRIAAPGFGADEVTFVADAHMADERFLDAKGRKPDPHELQHLCDNEGACDLGLTTDVLYMIHMLRGGEVRGVSLPYHVNKRARQVHWQSDVILMDGQPGNGRPGGFIVRALDAYLNAPTIDMAIPEGLMPEGSDMDERWWTDMAVLAVLTMIGFPVLWATKTDEERERVAVVLRNMGLSNDGQPPTGQPPAAMVYMAKKAQMEMAERSRATHAVELEEAARRRAERGE